MAGTADIDNVEVTSLDDPVQVDIDEIQPRRCAPMPQQTWLDMLGFQRLTKQGIVEQINLPDRKIVRGPPISVETRQFLRTQYAYFFAFGCCFPHRMALSWKAPCVDSP